MSKIKILLIEDEKMIAQNLKSVIENFGYELVGIATTGEEALEIAFDKSIDIVVSDIEIRGLTDGIDVSKTLQNTYNLPIIFTTAYNDEEKIKRASTVTNLVGYLVKPIRIDELDTLIKIAISKYKILEKRNLKDIASFYKYDYENKKIYVDEEEIALTRNESLLLSLLLNTTEKVLSYESINGAIWKEQKGSDVARRQLVHRLKTKLDKLPILSEKGIGIYIKE
ncbi:response regulator [Poseidonibacter lekithochrous]|uniref:response regulator n=1 Tax=Poseidonibacter lekithochrous TaxID=1904463 RepID=UPI0008FC9748|nr:response regulator [Poseidonibacter lekithochrous]QKJ22461.1 response regulator receiver domain-containing protein [Poseidonibacter lekithochrous]